MMKNILLHLCLSLGLVLPVYAEENIPTENTEPAAQVEENIAENVPETVAVAEQEQNEILENADLSVDKEKKPELVIEHKIEKDLQPLPKCNDDNLQKKAYEYIYAYFDTSVNYSTLYRRHKYFILNNLSKFAEQNIADYKTAETSPVSDIIAHVKMNKGVIEENMRLCKNTSTNKHAGKVYLLIYPEDENNYTVQVINLSKEPQENAKFLYAK